MFALWKVRVLSIRARRDIDPNTPHREPAFLEAINNVRNKA
jgi:hypothetical protein